MSTEITLRSCCFLNTLRDSDYILEDCNLLTGLRLNDLLMGEKPNGKALMHDHWHPSGRCHAKQHQLSPVTNFRHLMTRADQYFLTSTQAGTSK